MSKFCQFCFSGTDSIFKTLWLNPDPAWQNVAWNQTFDLAFSIRDTFYQSVGNEDPIGFDLAIYAKPKLFNEIKVSMKYLVNIFYFG